MASLVDLLVTGGAGFFAGFATGYAVKKALKILLFLLGSYLAVTLYLYHLGVLEIHWDRMRSLVEEIFGKVEQMVGFYQSIAAAVPMGGFLAGFLLGLKYG